MFTDAILNGQNDVLASKITKVSMHTADPGTTGANEAPGIPKVNTAWPASNAGMSTTTLSYPSFVGKVTHLGFWNGTTFVGSIPNEVNFAVAATLTIALRMRHPRG